jgi:hypothetical protein
VKDKLDVSDDCEMEKSPEVVTLLVVWIDRRLERKP